MAQQSQTMRVMTETYEQLARIAEDPAEHRRLGEYVKLYRDLEMQFTKDENEMQARDRRE